MRTAPAPPSLDSPAGGNGAGLRRHSTAILIGIFILGILAGGSGGVAVAPVIRHHFMHHVSFVRRMQQTLNLTPQQTAEFASIMSDTGRRFEALRNQTLHQADPQFEQIRQDGRNRIRAILNPRQLAIFNNLLAQSDRQRARGAAAARPTGRSSRH